MIDMSTYLEKSDKQKKDVASYLTSLQEKFREKGIEAQNLIGHGPVVKAIIDAA